MLFMEKDNIIFDIDKITSFIFGNLNERTNDVEITETYDYNDKSGDLMPRQKVVREAKVNQSTIRYDMIKMFIDILDGVDDESLMTLGQKLTMKTMEAYGLITEIKTNENE